MLPTLEEIKSLVGELKMDNQARNERDTDLLELFLNGNFTGKLYDAIRTQTRVSKQRKLIINVCRNAMIDRTVLLTMLPDVKVDPPDNLPYMDALFWQDRIMDTIKQFLWEQQWQLPGRMSDLAFWQAVKGRSVLQLFPNFEKKVVDLWIRDPSTYYAVVSGSGAGYMPDSNSGISYPSSGGYKHSPVLFISTVKGREILKTYPHLASIGIENTSDTYEHVEYIDENYLCHYISGKKFSGSFSSKEKYKYMTKEDGELMAVEHNLGFIPIEHISDVHEPGRIDGTSSIYHAIMMGENLNDLLLMNTEEHRSRLGSVLFIKDPMNVPNPFPEHGNAVVTGGPQSDAKYLSKVENPSDMGSHVEAIKNLTYMSLKTSGVRMGDMPTSGPLLGKGLNAAASIPISDEVMLQRENIARALASMDNKAFKMMQKMFGSVKQTMTVHSSAKSEGLDFKFNDLPKSFRHTLEVFPLSHDIPSLAVLLMQMRGQGAISLQTMLERIPGFDAPEEIRRLEVEKKQQMEEMMAMQQAQMQQEQAAAAPQDAEAEAYAMERGAMPGSKEPLQYGQVPFVNPVGSRQQKGGA